MTDKTENREVDRTSRRGPVMWWSSGMLGVAIVKVFLIGIVAQEDRPTWQTVSVALYLLGGALVLAFAAWMMWSRKQGELKWMLGGFAVYALDAIVYRFVG